MKKNIFTNSRSLEKTIFKDETVLYPEYTPETILSRESQIDEITYLLKPILKNKKANNILIYGPPGTGKTLLSKYILNELTEYTTRAKFIYINIIEDNTTLAILSKLAIFFQLAMPRRGLSIDEIVNRIKDKFKTIDFWPIIIFDEIDKIDSKSASKLLYTLSRAEYKSKYFTLILITNYKSCILKLDHRTQSSLLLSQVEFLKYSPIDLKQILNERIKYGLIPNSISTDLIGFIAGYASKRGGDARIAIDLLFKASKNTERMGKLKITKEILLKSARLVDSIKLSDKIKYISKEEYSLFNLIDDGILVCDLYKISKIPERTIRRYLSNLEKIELIKIKNINKGAKKYRKVFLNFDMELIK